jgi:hypothetical protein
MDHEYKCKKYKFKNQELGNKMMNGGEGIKTCKDCYGKEISNVRIRKDEGTKYITGLMIGFVDEKLGMEIMAMSDCCSFSWIYLFENKKIKDKLFENKKIKDKDMSLSNIREVVGKKMKSIEYVEDTEMPLSNIQECDLNHVYQIIFEDGTNYEFVLRNSSNGFYDGWIDIIVTKIESIFAEPNDTRALCYDSEYLDMNL